MKLPLISNPEKTILISKQAFAERIAHCAAVMIAGHEELIPLFARYMGLITATLFEDDIEFGDDNE